MSIYIRDVAIKMEVSMSRLWREHAIPEIDGSWSDYYCWLVLGLLNHRRGAIVQRLVAASTVHILGARNCE